MSVNVLRDEFAHISFIKWLNQQNDTQDKLSPIVAFSTMIHSDSLSHLSQQNRLGYRKLCSRGSQGHGRLAVYVLLHVDVATIMNISAYL